jgi:serine/threonine-protein kinase
MRLGGSLRRSRGKKKRPASAASEPKKKKAKAASATPGGWGGRLVLAAVLGLLGWGVGYFGSTELLFPAPPPPGDLFEVPDVRGLGLASARERLAGTNLEFGIVDSLRHPSVNANLILGQSPLPGQLALAEAPVRVTISLGPEMRSIPDVRRLAEERARIVLQTSGFVVSVDSTESDLPRGRVVEVDPPPDSIVALPAQVRLLVSTGPPLVSMPLVLGLEQAEAVALLDSLGLVVRDVEEVFRFGRDQGIVVEQEPPADTPLEPGTEVRLAVGRRGR